jgi:hypothetical protein
MVNAYDSTYNMNIDAFISKFSNLPEFICGDANSDGLININDISYITNYLYHQGPDPYPLECADVDGSGSVNVLDIGYLISFLYKGGSALNCPQ